MATSIREHFHILPDPRVERTKLHKLEDILTIAICAVICGAETWVDIADKSATKSAPNGVISSAAYLGELLNVSPLRCGTTGV